MQTQDFKYKYYPSEIVRAYENGCRPLNEALRNRIQHAEKMVLPPVEFMAERAAAIGQDKEMLCDIYGQEHFIDITYLKQLPARMVQMISKYL